jgi:putative restriction endonuclease
MIAIAPTDLDWFTQLRSITPPGLVNFWTPTPWNVRRLAPGDLLYFLLKSPIRKIGGYGAFSHYENLSVEQAWQKYGLGNGVQSLEELLLRTRAYVSQRTDRNSVQANTEIGCILLSHIVFLDDADFFTPESEGLSFPRQVVKIKYFDTPGVIASTESVDVQVKTDLAPYQLTTTPQKLKRQGLNVVRPGQSRFRNMVLEAYSRRCAISGETTEEILEAAHIQSYAGTQSDHVQNGIALRTDLHRLFDAGLLTIDDGYTVKVSNFITSDAYRKLQGQTINLPKNEQHRPSLDSLKFHRSNVFRTS